MKKKKTKKKPTSGPRKRAGAPAAKAVRRPAAPPRASKPLRGITIGVPLSITYRHADDGRTYVHHFRGREVVGFAPSGQVLVITGVRRAGRFIA